MNKNQDLHNTISSDSPTLYFVDGYHGGLKGHMPQGSVADILKGLDTIPEWKVSLEVEPISFDWLRKHEPDTFYRLKEYVEADYDDVRVEIVSGAHAQAFMWAIGGESVIRQLTLGGEYVKESFPKAVVDTYAVQEPCWTSSLPQLLNSLGFRRAVLKNSTCWGGYTRGFDKEILFWLGPDGSRIACVPRYECEDLVLCWAIQGSGYDKDAMDVFAQKCLDRGIEHPVGVELQDLGWRGRPWINEKYQHYTTWREYFNTIANKPIENLPFTQEDILVSIPWGEKTLHKMSRQVRESENRIVAAEKYATLASVMAHAEYPAEDFTKAWYQLLLSQHHDAWICAPCGSWARKAEFQTSFTDETCTFIIDDAFSAVNEKEITLSTNENKQQYLRIYSSTLGQHTGLITTMLTVPEGTKKLKITDSNGNTIPCATMPTRSYRGNAGAVRVTFPATVCGYGYTTYSVTPDEIDENEQPIQFDRKRWLEDKAAPDGASVFSVREGNTVIMENELYRIVLDLAHGGTFSSLVNKATGNEYVDVTGEYRFNEYRGYFIEKSEFLSTADTEVVAHLIENNGLCSTVLLEGKLGDQGFKTFVRLETHSRFIGLQNQFFFERGTQIGDPWRMPPERSSLEYRKADHDDRYKLHAMFPCAFGQGDIYKESAFAVEKSKVNDTRFSGWNDIKHRVMLHFVDEYSENENRGLALWCDHTNGYLYGEDYPLGLTLAYGGMSGFWWGDCRLDGMQETRYVLIPHEGKWDTASLCTANEELCEPLQFRSFRTGCSDVTREFSLMRSDKREFILSSAVVSNGAVIARFYNAGDAGDCLITLGKNIISVVPCAPDGGDLPNEATFSLSVCDRDITLHDVPKFGVRTIKIMFA